MGVQCPGFWLTYQWMTLFFNCPVMIPKSWNSTRCTIPVKCHLVHNHWNCQPITTGGEAKVQLVSQRKNLFFGVSFPVSKFFNELTKKKNTIFCQLEVVSWPLLIWELKQPERHLKIHHFCNHAWVIPSPLVCKLFTNYTGIKLVWAVWKWEQKMKFYRQEFKPSTQMQNRRSFHTVDHFASLIKREQLRGGPGEVNRLASHPPLWLPLLK